MQMATYKKDLVFFLNLKEYIAKVNMEIAMADVEQILAEKVHPISKI